jgi:DNA repair exonuclease SbcCD ATPase subunit
MEGDLKVLETNVEQAHKLEEDLEKTQNSIKTKTERSDKISEDIKSWEGKLASLGAKQDEIKGLQESITALRAQRDLMAQESKAANQRMLTDYSDTDEELKSIYTNFKQQHLQLVRAIEEKQNALKQLEEQLMQSEKEMGKLNEQIGKLQAQEAEYKKKKSELVELGNRLGSGGAAVPVLAVSPGGSSHHGGLLHHLQTAFQNKQAELAQQKSDSQALDTKFEAELSAQKKEESAMNEAVRLKTEQMRSCKAKRSEPGK